ncbi:hypothetical protein [Pseudonocardia adelaidensis]|uniref:VCBS repeat protein n=1 Tax=Pseudonocardia adelaidensis TaxID=648754 RepID=A0ABP9NSM0_9PSEU
MTQYTMRALAASAVAAAALLLVPGVAAAHEQAAVVSTDADVDGDGLAEPVTLRQLSPGTQLLRIELPSGYVEDQVPGLDGVELPLIVPSVVDVNGDGRDELVLSLALGVNTTTFEVWGFDDDRLHALTTEDGAPWRLYEGGGMSAVGEYGCVPGTPGRQLRTVQAVMDDAASRDGTPRYDGEVVTYVVAGGVAHPAGTGRLEDVTRDDPRAQADPATCAAVS